MGVYMNFPHLHKTMEYFLCLPKKVIDVTVRKCDSEDDCWIAFEGVKMKTKQLGLAFVKRCMKKVSFLLFSCAKQYFCLLGLSFSLKLRAYSLWVMERWKLSQTWSHNLWCIPIKSESNPHYLGIKPSIQIEG